MNIHSLAKKGGAAYSRSVTRSCPLRKIVGVSGAYDLLECGHQVFGASDIYGERHPDKRRCKKCGPRPEARKARPRHTRGPWTYGATDVIGPDGIDICNGVEPDPNTSRGATLEGNLSLIAAAPALLELVEQALDNSQVDAVEESIILEWQRCARLVVAQARNEA